MHLDKRIPFTEFTKPIIIIKHSDHIYVRNDIETFKSKKVYQNVFIYWVIDESILRDKKGIFRMNVTGTSIPTKTIFRKNVFSPFGIVTWSLHLPSLISSCFILCNFTDGNQNINLCYYVLKEGVSRKERKVILKVLSDSADKFGFPSKEDDVFYEYVEEKRYEEKFGYKPENNTTKSQSELESEMFQILQMNPTKDSNAIRESYRKLVRKYHPDLSGETDSEEFTLKIKEINRAYEYLYKKYHMDSEGKTEAS
jgi:DNA-binding protein Fis